MAVVCYVYLDVLNWLMTLPTDAMISQATALTATAKGAMSGACKVWLRHVKQSKKFLLNLAQFRCSGVRPSWRHAATNKPF